MVSEEDFGILVLSEAKTIFNNREAKYLRLSRMEKLVALVAEEVKYEKEADEKMRNVLNQLGIGW